MRLEPAGSNQIFVGKGGSHLVAVCDAECVGGHWLGDATSSVKRSTAAYDPRR